MGKVAEAEFDRDSDDDDEEDEDEEDEEEETESATETLPSSAAKATHLFNFVTSNSRHNCRNGET